MESAVCVPGPRTLPLTVKLTGKESVYVEFVLSRKVTVWSVVFPGMVVIYQSIFLFIESITGAVLLKPLAALPTS